MLLHWRLRRWQRSRHVTVMQMVEVGMGRQQRGAVELGGSHAEGP